MTRTLAPAIPLPHWLHVADGCLPVCRRLRPGRGERGARADPGGLQSARQPRVAAAAQRASAHLLSLRSSLRLGAEHDFAVRSAVSDEQGRLYLRYDQTFRGLKVWASDVIVEMSAENAPARWCRI